MKRIPAPPRIDWPGAIANLVITAVAITFDSVSGTLLDRRKPPTPKKRYRRRSWIACRGSLAIILDGRFLTTFLSQRQSQTSGPTAICGSGPGRGSDELTPSIGEKSIPLPSSGDELFQIVRAKRGRAQIRWTTTARNSSSSVVGVRIRENARTDIGVCDCNVHRTRAGSRRCCDRDTVALDRVNGGAVRSEVNASSDGLEPCS